MLGLRANLTPAIVSYRATRDVPRSRRPEVRGARSDSGDLLQGGSSGTGRILFWVDSALRCTLYGLHVYGARTGYGLPMIRDSVVVLP